MKSNLLLLLTALTSITMLKAQDMEVQWGLQTKDGGSSTSYIPLGWNAGHYYVVQIDGNNGNFIMTLLLLKSINASAQWPYGKVDEIKTFWTNN